MQLGMVGLGRMGANLVRRLMGNGHRCVVFNRTRGPVDVLVREGAIGSNSLEELLAKLDKPRAVWVMLPAGQPTENAVSELGRLMDRGDIVIDGGNSFYKDDIRRAQALQTHGVHYVDVMCQVTRAKPVAAQSFSSWLSGVRSRKRPSSHTIRA